MIVKLAVSKEVRDMIDSGCDVIKAKTNFDTPPSKEAYQMLKVMSNFDNFFFSFRVNDLVYMDSVDYNLIYRNIWLFYFHFCNKFRMSFLSSHIITSSFSLLFSDISIISKKSLI